MKYLTEFRNPELAKKVLKEIESTITRPWKIMEVCVGQTHSLVKNGILTVLPKQITMLHGPGCPVCVTPLHLIDKAVYLALEKEVILCFHYEEGHTNLCYYHLRLSGTHFCPCLI